jgi:D-alanyl-D-alanine carboxypeptidase/D-alanyl-D-alanine-endopeptidase (penicillin-binding protein 4)
MKLNSKRSALAIILLACSIAQASTSQLASAVDQLLADPLLRHGSQGVVVKSLRTGRVLYDRSGDTVLIPASNMKLLVSAAALDTFGPEHMFVTRIYSAGTLSTDGTLVGDIVLVGGGDPVLKRKDLAELARSVAEKGVRRVKGVVVGDDTLFDDVRLGLGWAWSDEPYYYSAEISALCIDGNSVDVSVLPGSAAGQPVKVRLEPETSYLRVVNTAVTSGSGTSTISVDREHGKNVVRVSGRLPIGVKYTDPVERISVADPPRYVAEEFRSALEAAGVKVEGRALSRKLPAGATQLAEHASPPLREILLALLKPSDNLIAEMLFKSLGAAKTGFGTAESAEAAEMEFVRRAGMDPGAIGIADGSGLSRRNYISPNNLVALLSYMWRHKYGRVYTDSLPVAGVDGTLRRRMKGTPAEGNVRAKTGYVSRVSCLSGYVTTKSGEPLVFSIMMNGHLSPVTEATAVQDRICELLAKYSESPSKDLPQGN